MTIGFRDWEDENDRMIRCAECLDWTDEDDLDDAYVCPGCREYAAAVAADEAAETSSDSDPVSC